jgi:hypothetical protein
MQPSLMRLFIFSSLLIALFFSSCQKELDIDPNDPPPPGSTNDSIYLSAYIELDTTLPPGQDTLTVTRFFYDNDKRLTQYSWVEMIGSGPGSTSRPGSIKYYYNGNDTLPYKITAASGDDNGAPTMFDTVFYAYTSNGMVSKDSGWSYLVSINGRSSLDVTNFTGTGSNVSVSGYSVDYTTQPPVTGPFAGVVNLVFSGGEIISQTSPPLLTGYEYFQLDYTDHPDPIYRIDFHYPVYYGYVGWGFGSTKKLLISQDVGTAANAVWAKYR